MALENNLGIRAERLSPQVQALAVAQTRANYAPIVFSNTTKNSNTNPPQNFQQGSDFVTNAGVRSNAGVAQALKWGGGTYQASLDGSKNTTSDPTDPFNPRLASNFNFNFTQPLLRNFTIDQTRQQLLLGQKQQEIVDLQLQQQLTQTSRAVRNAYYDLVGAIGQLAVAQQSLDLAKESLKNNERRVEVGTIPPIDIVEAQAEVSRNEEAVIITEAQVKSLEDALRTLVMNPSQPDFWTTHLVPSEQPVLTPHHGGCRSRDSERAGQADRPRAGAAQMDQTDITLKFARNQKLPGGQRGCELRAAGCWRHANHLRHVGGISGGDRSARAAKLQRRLARHLRQRVQDLEHAIRGELSPRHERRRRGGRPGPRAARAAGDDAARARTAGYRAGARRGASGRTPA